MAQINQSSKQSIIYTHEGGKAKIINAELQLRRSVMACMLWENTFYENGEDISTRIETLVEEIKPEKVAEIAIEAREKMKLRHIPLLLARILARLKYKGVSKLLERIIQRADELPEFVAIYWKEKKQPLSAQVKKGLAKAFTKFNEYELAKYNRNKKIKLRDVLFLCHAKPKDKTQAEIWKRLIDNKLQIPDTWEVALSSGKDKKESWERLLKEKKLGALALLRNLRNMQNVNCDESLIRDSIKKIKTERVLPFRFIAAARYAKQLEPELEQIMLKCLDEHNKLKKKTILLIDVSGSMDSSISNKSELSRLDAACGLAILLREICEDVAIYTFSNIVVQIPPRRGFALRDSIIQSQPHGGTHLGNALSQLNDSIKYERIIVLTDEQAHDNIPNPISIGYIINVACYKNGIGYGKWIHIDGWSEAIIDYIFEFESSFQKNT